MFTPEAPLGGCRRIGAVEQRLGEGLWLDALDRSRGRAQGRRLLRSSTRRDDRRHDDGGRERRGRDERRSAIATGRRPVGARRPGPVPRPRPIPVGRPVVPAERAGRGATHRTAWPRPSRRARATSQPAMGRGRPRPPPAVPTQCVTAREQLRDVVFPMAVLEVERLPSQQRPAAARAGRRALGIAVRSTRIGITGSSCSNALASSSRMKSSGLSKCRSPCLAEVSQSAADQGEHHAGGGDGDARSARRSPRRGAMLSTSMKTRSRPTPGHEMLAQRPRLARWWRRGGS